MPPCLDIYVDYIDISDSFEFKLVEKILLEFFRGHPKIKWYVVNDHGSTVGHSLHVFRFFSSRNFYDFSDHVLLHRIEICLLALSRHPLETIPEEVTFAIFRLLGLGTVRVFLLKIRVLRHIIDYGLVA